MLGYTVNIVGLISAQTGLHKKKKPRGPASDCGRTQTLSHPGSTGNNEDTSMAELLDRKDVVEFKELLMANTIQIDAMYQLLVQKGYFTQAEFLVKMKEVQADYKSN